MEEAGVRPCGDLRKKHILMARRLSSRPYNLLGDHVLSFANSPAKRQRPRERAACVGNPIVPICVSLRFASLFTASLRFVVTMLVAHMMPHAAAVTTPNTHKTFQWRTSFASTYTHSSSTSSSSNASSCDDVLDLEALALSAGSDYEDTFRSSRWRHSDREDYYGSTTKNSSMAMAPGGSGLPLVCSNCGVSFFSLQITDDELECYCSGECKWSVVMYREMDRRMHALRRHVRAAAAMATRAGNRSVATSTSSFAASARSSAASTVDTAESYAAHHMDDVIPCR